MNHGISKEALNKYLKNCSELTCDIPYGKTLRFLTNQCSKQGFLDSIIETAKKEKVLRNAFFNIVSGQETYKKTWIETRNFKLFSKMTIKAVLSKFSKKKSVFN